MSVLIIKLELPSHRKSYGNISYRRNVLQCVIHRESRAVLPPSPAASLSDHLVSSSCGPLLNFSQKVAS